MSETGPASAPDEGTPRRGIHVPAPGMNDLHTEDELHARLAAATTAEERGELHRALAVCAGRALEYRRMNHHEEASAKAHAERSEPLRIAHATYRAAIAAFGDRDDAQGLALLRQAQPAIVAELGDRHPYAHQVTNTLAGRLDGAHTLAERHALRRWLVEGSTALYGATHPHTLKCVVHEAYLLAALGHTHEAIAAFERAIDGLLVGPWPGEAATALRPLAELCIAAGTPDRTAARERQIFAGAPGSRWTVREVFFCRAPVAAAHFNAAALAHTAAHFPALRHAADDALAATQTEAAIHADDDGTAAAAFTQAIHAYRTVADRTAPCLPADWVLTALSRLASETRAQQPTRGESDDPACACHTDGDDEDDEGPLAAAERERQDALFAALLGEDPPRG